MHITKTVKDVLYYGTNSIKSIENKEVSTQFSSYLRNILVFVVLLK